MEKAKKGVFEMPKIKVEVSLHDKLILNISQRTLDCLRKAEETNDDDYLVEWLCNAIEEDGNELYGAIEFGEWCEVKDVPCNE